MKKSSSGFLLILLLAAATLMIHSCKKNSVSSSTGGPPPPTDTDANTTVNAADTSFEIGGSNYPFYAMGTYLQDTTLAAWNLPYNLRPVIATYHLAPQTVKTQSATMYANGQRKIALDLWYADLSSDPVLKDSPIFAHLVNSKFGYLIPQHASNLVNLLNDIVNQGFNEIMFRFDSQAESDSKEWTSWEESEYQLDRGFIFSVKDLVKQTLAGKNIKVLWDLDGELAGAPVGQAAECAERLWRDWTNKYGSHNTVGFSFATAPQRLTNAIAIYDRVGKRPDIYSFDIYGNELATFTYLKAELAAVGEDKKPVFAEEVYYNDRETFNEIMQARNSLPLNIKFMIQWPMSRGHDVAGFSVDYPAAYNEYLP